MKYSLYSIHEINEGFEPKKVNDDQIRGPRNNVMQGLHQGTEPEALKTTGEFYGTFEVDPEKDQGLQIDENKKEISERTGISVNQILIQYEN